MIFKPLTSFGNSVVNRKGSQIAQGLFHWLIEWCKSPYMSQSINLHQAKFRPKHCMSAEKKSKCFRIYFKTKQGKMSLFKKERF